MRKIECEYRDPLDEIWLRTAGKLGMQVIRSKDVFASWDGKQTLVIGAAETLDPDDSLAQMIFHEICHAITEGPDSWGKEDWGLLNDEPKHVVREEACLRLQATLAAQYDLRLFLATTTDFREYYDRLPKDPLAGDGEACLIAREAHDRSAKAPWSIPLTAALEATRLIRNVVQSFSSKTSLWKL